MTDTLELEKKISSALAANGSTPSSASLAELLTEVDRAIIDTTEAAKTAREQALDPAVFPDPKKARAEMEDTAFRCGRMQTLRPRLQARLAEVAAAERLKAWREKYDALKLRRDVFSCAFQDVVIGTFPRMAELFEKMEQVDREIHLLHLERPANVPDFLRGCEAEARNIDSFNLAQPSIIKGVVLPNHWPKRQTIDPMIYHGLGDRHPGPGWQDAKSKEEAARREREEKQLAERAANAVKEQEARNSPVWWSQQGGPKN